MKARTVTGALVGGARLTAAANHALDGRAGTLDPPLPGAQRTYRWRGFDIGCTEAGNPENPDLLLVHEMNAAGSSREFEAVFERLAESHHCLHQTCRALAVRTGRHLSIRGPCMRRS